MLRKQLVAIAGAAALLISASEAQATVLTFPSASSFSYSATNGSATGLPSMPMWTAGDYITQTYTGTGLSAVNSLDYNLKLFDGISNNTETLSIQINGIQVDTQNVAGCGPVYCSSDVAIGNLVNFSPIVGNGDYTLKIALTNDIGGGIGYINFDNSGLFTISNTTVPEPSTVALFGLGLVGLSVARRRTRQSTPDENTKADTPSAK